jgi:UPF0489 domain
VLRRSRPELVGAERIAMRILDLDLDFFLSDIAFCCGGSSRLSSADYLPWSEERVRRFLENQCGLDRTNPIPGKVVTHHHEVFHDWRRLIEGGRLATPFDVVHIDAHADLGLGDSSYWYIMTDLLSRPVPERPRWAGASRNGLAASNYLAFGVACRWLSRIVYVRHPECRDDLFPYYIERRDSGETFIELKYYGNVNFTELAFGSPEPLAVEPRVPLELIAGVDFSTREPFTRIYLAQSPPYTPPEADALIPVIRQYIAEED